MMNNQGKDFLLRKKKECACRSLGYYLRYREHEDSAVLAEFVQSSPFAVNEVWFMKTIMRLSLRDQHHRVQEIFTLKKGGRKTENEYAARNFMIVSRVDGLSARGMSKKEAFNHISSQDIGLTSPCYIDKEQIKKVYYTTKRKEPAVYVKDLGEFYEIVIYPAKVSFVHDGKRYFCFGLLEMKLPKKQ